MSAAVPIPKSGTFGNGHVQELNDGQSGLVFPRTVGGLSYAFSSQQVSSSPDAVFLGDSVRGLFPARPHPVGSIKETDVTIAREFCNKIAELDSHKAIVEALKSGEKPKQELVLTYCNDVNSLMNCYSEKVREAMRPILSISKPKSYLLKKGFWLDNKQLTALSWAAMQSNLILVKMFSCEVVGRVDDLEMQAINYALGDSCFIANEFGYYLFASFLFRNIVVEVNNENADPNHISPQISICYNNLCDYLSRTFKIDINHSKIPDVLCQILEEDKDCFQSNSFYEQILTVIKQIKEKNNSIATGAPVLAVRPNRSVIGFHVM